MASSGDLDNAITLLHTLADPASTASQMVRADLDSRILTFEARHGRLDEVRRRAYAGYSLLGGVRGEDQTAGLERVDQGVHDGARVLVVADEVQDRDQHERDRLRQVEQVLIRQDPARVTQVSLDAGGAATDRSSLT